MWSVTVCLLGLRGVDRELDRDLPVLSGRVVVLDQGRVEDAVLRAGREVAQVFALVGDERGDEDQADDVRGAASGVADDRAASSRR
jgi:hypothetical protein